MAFIVPIVSAAAVGVVIITLRWIRAGLVVLLATGFTWPEEAAAVVEPQKPVPYQRQRTSRPQTTLPARICSVVPADPVPMRLPLLKVSLLRVLIPLTQFILRRELVVIELRKDRAAKFIIFNTEFIIVNTESIIFNTKFIIFMNRTAHPAL